MELNAVLFSYLQDCAQGMIKLMSPPAAWHCIAWHCLSGCIVIVILIVFVIVHKG